MSSTVLLIKGSRETGTSAKAALERKGYQVLCCGVIGAGMRFMSGRRPVLEISSTENPGLVQGDLVLDEGSQLAVYKDVRIETLTAREFRLLYELVRNAPRLLTREEIITSVWRTAAVTNLVDTHLYNMRRKLPDELAARVQAVAGRGFRYRL